MENFFQIFLKISLRDLLVCVESFVGKALLSVFLSLPLPNCFLRVCLRSFTLLSWNFFATNNLCNLWRCKFQQSNSNVWQPDVISTEKWKYSSLNTLYKCAKFSSTVSTNTSVNWNLYVSRSNGFLTCFRLEMNVGGFSEHKNKASDTDIYKRCFSTAGVSQINVITMERSFEQRSEMHVAECLIVHVLSSRYNVSRLELRNKKSNAAMMCSWRQRYCTQSGPCISWESVCGQCCKQLLVCEVLSFSTLLHYYYRHYFPKCVSDPY